MTKTRLEAFSDGVLAILITIMVLELKVPHGLSWEEIHPALTTIATYVLSFLVIAIYWVNHHHMLHTIGRVNAKIMWANIHLLFWLSLVAFVTAWLNETSFNSISVAAYGVDMIMCAISYQILGKVIKQGHTLHPKLSEVLHRSGPKEWASTALYASSVPLAFVAPVISCVIYVIVPIVWIIPNKEIERALEDI